MIADGPPSHPEGLAWRRIECLEDMRDAIEDRVRLTLERLEEHLAADPSPPTPAQMRGMLRLAAPKIRTVLEQQVQAALRRSVH